MRRRFLASVLSLLAVSAGSAAYAASNPYEIQLLTGRFTPAPGTRPAGLENLAKATDPDRKIHVLLQLREVPEDTRALSSAGIDLGVYATGRSWIAAVPASALTAVAARSDVRAMVLWDASRKVHPRVHAKDFASWAIDKSRPGWIMLFVQLHHDVPIETGYKLADAVGGAAMPPVEGLHGMTIWVEEDKVKELALSEDVLWIQEGPPPLTANNDGARATMRVNQVNAAPYNLTGTGVRAFVFDAGTVRSTHETFNTGGPSRVTVIDASAVNAHPTHVAGTVGGDGAPTSTGGAGRGVATGATILSSGYQQVGGTMLFWDNAGDIEADYTLGRNTHNADLITNSIGSNTASNGYPCTRQGDYDITGSLLDGIVRDNNPAINDPVILTWANGNERGGGSPRARCGANYLTTAPPSCAKNPIHVGAINSDGSSMTSFSSWGPCDDGRMKPVISAPGCETGRVTGQNYIYSSVSTNDTSYGGACGTSMSTPAVAGTVALMIQDWRARGFGGATARPLPALVKSWLIHGATDLGLDGPDYIYGYGGVNAQKTIDILRAGSGTLVDAATAWGTDSATNGSVDNFFITVPANTAELKATLAWDDAAAAAFAANAVVNNLTLELIAPDTTVRRAWVLNPASPHLAATTGNNALDNQEQVLVQNPAAGVWTVRVTGTAVPTGPQTYGLVYTRSGAPTGGCTTTASTFEAGNDSWTLSGASRLASPAAGHGSFSMRLGSTSSSTHEVYRNFTIPAGVAKAEWTFFWYMTTQEVAASGFGWDFFRAEVRTAAGTVLAVVDERSDGWRPSTWLKMENIDLTPWAGQTVRLAFRTTNDGSLPTTFWVDSVNVETCPP